MLLRGINLGSTNRVPMPALREALGEAGYENVETYVQSGNVVLDTDLSPGDLEQRFAALLSERFDLSVPVVTRTRDELAEVVARNPLRDVADDPKRYQVSFLSGALEPAVLAKLEELAVEPERVVAVDREVYAWHPAGVARSKLWNGLAAKDGLGGITATARNWTTVTTLLEMASRDGD